VRRRISEAISRCFRPALASLLIVALLGLIGLSLEQIYVVVVEALLTGNRWPEAFRVAVLVAAAIPLGFLAVYSGIAVVAYVRQLWILVSRQNPP